MSDNRKLGNLVCVSFREAAPARIGQLSEKDKHCRFIGRARQGEPFYIPAENINCPLARYYLAIGRTDLKDLAEILVGWSDAADVDTGLKFLKSGLCLQGHYKYIIYFPYRKDSAGALKPDVIIRVANPLDVQRILKRHSSLTGESVGCGIGGVGAACGECTAQVIGKKSPTISVGCGGSRPGIGLRDDEMLVAAPLGSKMFEVLTSGG